MNPLPEGLQRLIASWRVLTTELEQLRAVHAAALNTRVAQRCRGLIATPERPLAERLERVLAGVAGSRWTTPELAHAHYVALQPEAPTSVDPAALVDSLEAVGGRAPSFRLGVSRPAPVWVDHALRVFEGDQLRDGHRPARLEPSDSCADRDTFLEGYMVLGQAWPEMASAAECLVRAVVWFEPFGGSATLPQAFGALFCSTGRDTAGAIEAIVHETTHLELMARTSVDRLLLNGGQTARSPFRRRPRPLTRVLHAALVARRVAHAMELCADHLSGAQRAAAARHRAAAERGLKVALEALAANATWTGLGAELFESMRRDETTVAASGTG